MSVLAEVIPFSVRSSQLTGESNFSADDEAMTSSLIRVLADELTIWDTDGFVQARIYFYFGFHRYLVQRWVGLLAAQKTAYSRQLAQRLAGAFHFVTSTATMNTSTVDCDKYREKLDELADYLYALLRLIQAC